MNLWVVLDSLSNEPEVFTSRNDAVAFALEILEEHQKCWHYEREEYENSCSMIKKNDGDYWGAYLGECEVNIFKKFI